MEAASSKACIVIPKPFGFKLDCLLITATSGKHLITGHPNTTDSAPTGTPEQKRQDNMDRIATALRQTEGVEIKFDASKLSTLKDVRAKQKKELQAFANLIKLENRKKQRLMKKFCGLPLNDLLECARIRFDTSDAREKAKKLKAEQAAGAARSSDKED